MNRTLRWHNNLTFFVLGTGIFLFFQFAYPYHLFFKEQVQLFLFSPTYLFTYFSKPAVFSRLAGDFLTQFFYLRGGGPLVLTAVFLFEWGLLKRVLLRFDVPKLVLWWALLPVTVDFAMHLRSDWSLANSMGFVAVLALALLIRRLERRNWSYCCWILVAPVAYYFFGSAAFLLPFLLFFTSEKKEPLLIIVVTVLVVVVPLVLRTEFLLTRSELWFFPSMSAKGLLLPLSVPLTVLLMLLARTCVLAHWRRWVAVVFAFGGIAAGLTLNAEWKFERILAFDTEYYFGNYDRVLRRAESHAPANRYEAYYTNMVLARKGQLAERLLDFEQPAGLGLFLPVSKNENWQTIFFSSEVFFLLGDMNMAQHSAMLGNTFSPACRSVRMIKRLAEINVVNSDYPGAEKYLRLLDKTLFYRKWAKRIRLGARASTGNEELWRKRHQLFKTDTLRPAFDDVGSLQELVKQNPNNRIARDYLLCYYLLNKDLAAFRKWYDAYVLNRGESASGVYAEALLIDLLRTKAPEETLKSYRIPPVELARFADYNQKAADCQNNPEELRKVYGNTYWFYYQFATLKQEGRR